MKERPSRYSSRPFPRYAFVPGRFPHPVSDPDGHSYRAAAPAIDRDDAGTIHSQHLWAVDLFNHGYYWEAHEAWEALWHLWDRSSPAARWLQALIHLAACGVKALEGRPKGIRRHAARAMQLFSEVEGATIPSSIQLDFSTCLELARMLFDSPQRASEAPDSPASETCELGGSLNLRLPD